METVSRTLDVASSAPPRLPVRERLAQLLHWRRSGRHDHFAQRMAGAAFLIRAASAAFLFATQILFARWMGDSEFGRYVYVWTWAILIGDLLHLGLASVAPRFIPQHTGENRIDLLRGFISASCRIVFASAVVVACLAALAIRLATPVLDAAEITPLYLVCLVLPAYALSVMLDGISRSYNWIGLALLPPYVLRPLLLVTIVGAAHWMGAQIDATTVMVGAIGATWSAMAVQLFCARRSLARTIPPGPREHAIGLWLSTALPALMVLGFYSLLTYTDILVLRQFAQPADVAVYYAATKTLALVAMIHFAVGASVAHRFSEYHVAGDQERLAAFVAMAARWTFWPSATAVVVILALGWPILWLFGPGFVGGYPLMFILAIGLVARASVGPAERLLNMVDQQRACAGVYGAAFLINLALCITLVPRLGVTGAAISTATALCAESVMLSVLVRRRLGFRAFFV